MDRLLPDNGHQANKLQQVLEAERGTPGRDGHHRVRLSSVRPAGRNSDQPAFLIPVVKKLLAPVLPDGYDGKLLAAGRMERMDDAKDSIPIARTGCS